MVVMEGRATWQHFIYLKLVLIFGGNCVIVLMYTVFYALFAYHVNYHLMLRWLAEHSSAHSCIYFISFWIVKSEYDTSQENRPEICITKTKGRRIARAVTARQRRLVVQTLVIVITVYIRISFYVIKLDLVVLLMIDPRSMGQEL